MTAAPSSPPSEDVWLRLAKLATPTSFDGCASLELNNIFDGLGLCPTAHLTSYTLKLCDLIEATSERDPVAIPLAKAVLSVPRLETLRALMDRFPGILGRLPNRSRDGFRDPFSWLFLSKAPSHQLLPIARRVLPWSDGSKQRSFILASTAFVPQNAEHILPLAELLDIPPSPLLFQLPAIMRMAQDASHRHPMCAELFTRGFAPGDSDFLDSLYRSVTDNAPQVLLAAVARRVPLSELWHRTLEDYGDEASWRPRLARICLSGHGTLALIQKLDAIGGDAEIIALTWNQASDLCLHAR